MRKRTTSNPEERNSAAAVIAEVGRFGEVTTGAANDLQRATDIAEQMVGTYGMSDTLGPLAYDKQGGGRFLGGNNNSPDPDVDPMPAHWPREENGAAQGRRPTLPPPTFFCL